MLVPYPFATGDHQRYNAKALVENGAAIMVEDDMLNVKESVINILELMNDTEKLHKMSVASRKLSYPDAAHQLALRIIGLAHNH